MTTEEMKKLKDTLSQAFASFGKAIEELADSLRKFFDPIRPKQKKQYKLPNKYFTSSKNRFQRCNMRNLYSFERKIQRHLPYQRRNY